MATGLQRSCAVRYRLVIRPTGAARVTGDDGTTDRRLVGVDAACRRESVTTAPASIERDRAADDPAAFDADTAHVTCGAVPADRAVGNIAIDRVHASGAAAVAV